MLLEGGEDGQPAPRVQRPGCVLRVGKAKAGNDSLCTKGGVPAACSHSLTHSLTAAATRAAASGAARPAMEASSALAQVEVTRGSIQPPWPCGERAQRGRGGECAACMLRSLRLLRLPCDRTPHPVEHGPEDQQVPHRGGHQPQVERAADGARQQVALRLVLRAVPAAQGRESRWAGCSRSLSTLSCGAQMAGGRKQCCQLTASRYVPPCPLKQPTAPLHFLLTLSVYEMPGSSVISPAPTIFQMSSVLFPSAAAWM